jgi:hypothetical protein
MKSSLSTLPPLDRRGLRKEKSWQHLLKPLFEAHRYHPEKTTIKRRRTAARGRAKGGGSLERRPPRSTNAVFWEMPGDLLGDAIKHDNAPAFKHCQMRAPNSSCGVDPPMKAASQAVVKQSERLAFAD